MRPVTDGEHSTAGQGAIGLVGPMSNYAAPPQLVETGARIADLDEMRAFARRWRDEHRGKWFTVPKLSGFCLLIKRAVYDAIGGLDERFGLGFFDDDDLAERARRAGFELAVAHDLFVHHFGSRTFVGNGVDADKLLDENARRFASKWGLTELGGKRVALHPWQALPSFFAAQPARIRPPGRRTGKRPRAAIGADAAEHVKPNGTSLRTSRSDFSSEWKPRPCRSTQVRRSMIQSNPACAASRSA